MLKLYFYLPSNFIDMNSIKKITGLLMFSIVNEMKNDDTSGNQEKTVYCLLTCYL